MKRSLLIIAALLPLLNLSNAPNALTEEECVERRNPDDPFEEECENERVVEKYDPETQLDVVEYKSDLDLQTYCQNAEQGMFGYMQSQNLMEKFMNFRELSAGYTYE